MTNIAYVLRSAITAFSILLAFHAVGAPLSAPVFETSAAAQSSARLVASGNFVGADRSHTARGAARLVRQSDGSLVVQLRGFRVTGGPDLRVWVTDSSSISNARDARRASHVDLGRLRSSSGNQEYRIPAGALDGNHRSVVIWCRAFGVLFADAPLERS